MHTLNTLRDTYVPSKQINKTDFEMCLMLIWVQTTTLQHFRPMQL